MIQYPSVVSRTLDPTHKALTHVTGLHDRQLSDADLNLLQDVQSLKRASLLAVQVCSGCLTYSPFVFTPATALSFNIPTFAALVAGEMIQVGGNNSLDPTTNVVTLPAPGFYVPGSTASPVSIYIVYLEAWLQRLDPISGIGFAQSSLGNFFYPQGCVNAPQGNWIPTDVIDPFTGVETTERVQVQWALRVAPVATSYDFTKYAAGLDQGAIAAEIVYGQASQATPSVAAPYQFVNQGSVSGDPGLWRAGDGNPLNELATMDGYCYALPVAVVFQRNQGNFEVDANPFGCASPAANQTGLLASGVSGRYDGYFADVVYPSDVVDTRSTVALDGWDPDTLMRRGFVDVITGTAQQKIARGQTPGSQAIALGSQLAYSIAVAPVAMNNTDTVGAFDGYLNGFAASGGTYYSTQMATINQKVVGTLGARWQQNDAFTVTLATGSQAVIASLQVQGLVDNTVLSTRTPVLLLQGQTLVTGLGAASATVQIAKNLTNTTYDPGVNPIYCTVGVQYPSAAGMDLRHVPSNVYGGLLIDAASSATLPVFGVSEYDVLTAIPAILPATAVHAYNPEYSNTIFGTRITVPVAASSGMATVSAAGSTVTTFTLSTVALSGTLSGIYPVSATDQATGTAYTIVARSLKGNQLLLQVAGPVLSGSTLLVVWFAASTAQLAYNAPVRGVTAIEETVFGGTLTTTSLRMDARIQVVSTQFLINQYNTVVLAATGGILSGIAGDDVNKLIWVLDSQGSLDAVQITSAVFSGGFVTLTVPATVNLQTQPFFVVAALRPAFLPSSVLTLTEYYVPYQGEGVLNRDYEIVHTEQTALVTTNGTGAAPVPGLADIYPYNRELPIVTTLPAQVSWQDSGLANTSVQSMFDSNFVAKRYGNVEHTLEVPVHTNDFIEPVNDDKRKSFQFTITGAGRGFSKASPHLGFAIEPLTSRSAVGSNLVTTSAPITLFVNNVTGIDTNDGLTLTTPLLTLTAALDLLPPVLRHSCSIQLVPTGASFLLTKLASTLQLIEVGDGQIRPLNYHALGNLAFTIQDAGRLVISAVTGTIGNVTIDATGFQGFGDGPTYGFFVDTARVLFNQIQFTGFTSAAVYGSDADVEFVSCQFTNCVTAASFTQGSTVILDGGGITLASNSTGIILSESALVSSGTQFTVQPGANPGAFLVATYGSSIALQTHSPANETNVAAATMIATIQLNSSLTTARDFTSAGSAKLQANSVLSRTVSASPFAGGVTADASSSTTTSL